MTTKQRAPAGEAHKWQFKARFRRHAFGWKSQPAIARIKQAVAEIKKVAKHDVLLALLAIARACERVLLSSRLVDEAYLRYGLEANQAGTHLATFRAGR